MTDDEPERVDVAPRGLGWAERIAPWAQHGPLALVLLGVTVVTGVVDAVSYIALGAHEPIAGARRYAIVVVLAVALGGQNAIARRIAVPDITTTVVTLTLTALAADTGLAGGPGRATVRRIAAVAAMFAGALAGGLLTLRVSAAAALALATATAGAVALGAHRTARSGAGWAVRRP